MCTTPTSLDCQSFGATVFSLFKRIASPPKFTSGALFLFAMKWSHVLRLSAFFVSHILQRHIVKTFLKVRQKQATSLVGHYCKMPVGLAQPWHELWEHMSWSNALESRRLQGKLLREKPWDNSFPPLTWITIKTLIFLSFVQNVCHSGILKSV